MERFELHIEAESRIRWKVYVRFGGEFSETDHSNMARRRLLSLHFKFSDLSTIAYNHLLNHPEGYKVKPKFYVINFDDPRRSHRCNPIHPDFMEDITDAYESAYTIMLNLNKSWVQKQGDFFVESPIILFAAIIWYLKIFQNGKYCTFPHAIEFLNRRYEDIFPILTSYPGTGELSLAIHGRVARRGCGAVDGADSIGENSAVTDDFPAALLGDVGQRVHAGHQQSRRTENSLRGQQSRPTEHIRGGSRSV